MTHDEMRALATRLWHDKTSVTDLELGEAARAIYDLLEEVFTVAQRCYAEMERVEKCGHLFANIQPNGCLVCKLLEGDNNG